MKSLKQEIIDILKCQPMTSQELRKKLLLLNYKRDQIKSVIFDMWNSGELNVGLDQKLVIN